MPQEQLLAFLLFSVVAAVTPGPSNLMVFGAGARLGLARGMRCLAGVVAGMSLLMGLAVLGLGGVLQAYAPLLTLLKGCGAAFLLWLAWKIATAPPLGPAAQQPPVGFWQGFAFQWINPKSWIVSISAAAAFSSQAPGPILPRAVLLAAAFTLAAAPSGFLWLACGAALQRWLADARRSRLFNLAMGLLLAASVATIA